MTLARIDSWADGDSGEMVDSNGIKKRFRLSNVSAPEKHEPGYNMATSRSKRMLGEYDVVDVKVVGRDSFGRDLVEVKKHGRDINSILEMKNKLFDLRPPKKIKKDKRSSRRKQRSTS